MSQPFQTQDYRPLLIRLGLARPLNHKAVCLADSSRKQLAELEESVLQEVFAAAHQEARECVARGGAVNVSLPILPWCKAAQLKPEAFDEPLSPDAKGDEK